VRDAKGPAAIWCRPASPDQHFPCDDVLVAVVRKNAFSLDRARLRHRIRQMGHAQGRSKTFGSTNPKVVFGGDAAFGPKNIIWAVAHGHEAAISIDRFCRGEDITVPPAAADRGVEPEDGQSNEWELRQRDHAR